MIKIEAFEGKFGPVCHCDVCDLPITDASQGLVFYTSDPDGDVVSDVSHLFVHKGRCRDMAVAKHGDEGGDDEIYMVLIHLLNNMGYRGSKLKGLVDAVEGFDA